MGSVLKPFYGLLGMFAYLAVAVPAFGAEDTPGAQQHVALNLVLAVDASASISGLEFAFQIQAYARAFRTPAVISAIEKAGGIGLTMFIWSGLKQNQTIVSWRHVRTKADCHVLAEVIAQTERRFIPAGTSISDALRTADAMLAAAPLAAERKTIDLSGDGSNNTGPSVRRIRDALGARGVTINALAVENETEDLGRYYQESVVIGPGHFVIRVRSFADFATAIQHKLVREIAGALVSGKGSGPNGLQAPSFEPPLRQPAAVSAARFSKFQTP